MEVKEAWRALEGLYILLENDEELDKELQGMLDLSESLLNILIYLSPLHEAKTTENTIEYYMDQLAKLYAVCFMDEKLDKELGRNAAVVDEYLTVVLEKVIPVNIRREAIIFIKS